MCCLQAERDATGHPTLGFFKPDRIVRLKIVAEDQPNWTVTELARLRQHTLWENEPQSELQKIPHKFMYEYFCPEASCRGHEMMCTDWEIGQSYRSWLDRYGDNWEEKFREKFECAMIATYDTHFYVGTIHGHPKNWIIVGLWYPERDARGRLFPST